MGSLRREKKETREGGREGGAPQLLFAVRKRYHLPTYTEEGGAEKGVTMVVRL